MQRWEYARALSDRGEVTVSYSHRQAPSRSWPRVIEALRDLGDQGWELVTATNRDGHEVLHFRQPLES